MSDLVSIEADIDIVVTQQGDEVTYSLRLTHIKRTRGELESGPYKGIILVLREPIQEEKDVNVI